MTFYFSCIETNPRHTKFLLVDPEGAGCGTVCALTDDVPNFIGRHNWMVGIRWNGLLPKSVEDFVPQVQNSPCFRQRDPLQMMEGK